MIVAGLLVFEEIDFIKPCLQSCCELFDRVVVLEGSWATTAAIKGKRSSDGTIEEIEKLVSVYDNLELVFYNGSSQVDHRSAAWEHCKKYNPDWYLQGDGDEVFHEQDKQIIGETLAGYSPIDCVAPKHYLFWHDLTRYEMWNTAGARFFNVHDLDLNKVSAGPRGNQMSYDGSIIFRRHETEKFHIFHPSYVKNADRQNLKIKHRSADNGRKFPHVLVDGKMQRQKSGWMDELEFMEPSNLPKYFNEQNHITGDN